MQYEKIEVVVSGNCVVCGKPLNFGRLFICKECEAKNLICPTDECEDCPDYDREKGRKQIERLIDHE